MAAFAAFSRTSSMVFRNVRLFNVALITHFEILVFILSEKICFQTRSIHAYSVCDGSKYMSDSEYCMTNNNIYCCDQNNIYTLMLL